MSGTLVEQYAYILREIAERAELPSVKGIARQPGLKAVYRVTIRHAQGEARNSVATLWRALQKLPQLEVVYAGLFHSRPLVYVIALERYEGFALALQKARFDRLSDQPNVPFHGVDVWLVERAAGEFYHSVIIAPQTARADHVAVYAAVRHYLPEVVREIE